MIGYEYSPHHPLSGWRITLALLGAILLLVAIVETLQGKPAHGIVWATIGVTLVEPIIKAGVSNRQPS